jgi:chondroitin AC lyase
MGLLGPLIGPKAEEVIMTTPKPYEHDRTVIKERMLAALMEAPDADRVDAYRQSLQPDGHWEEVNYEGTATTSWEPAQHLRRLITLTQGWFSPDSPLHQDPELDKQINTALDYWLHKDPRRRWWWDAIGAPGMLSQIMLMRDGQLSDFQMSKGGQNVERAVLGATGQNLVWQAEITARRAVLQRDGDLLRRAFELIASEIRISDGEGIQPDFSFHQHKQVIYNHGSGSGFARDNVRLANLIAGTAFAYSPEKIALLSHYILDGSQWPGRFWCPGLRNRSTLKRKTLCRLSRAGSGRHVGTTYRPRGRIPGARRSRLGKPRPPPSWQ